MKRPMPNLAIMSRSGLPLLALCLFTAFGCGAGNKENGASPSTSSASVFDSGQMAGDTCSPCLDESATTWATCPQQRPTSPDELRSLCTEGWNSMDRLGVSLGACVPTVPPRGCTANAADPDVEILSASFSRQYGYDCHYSRSTGQLVGKVVSQDSPTYCGHVAYSASTQGVKNPWCRAGGPAVISINCNPEDGGVPFSGDAETPDLQEQATEVY
jgi:hypothetical protein